MPVRAGLTNRACQAPGLAGPLELASANVVLGQNYPQPIGDHAQAREKTLLRYAVVKKPLA